jgi:CO dehydrogenase maturation factor
MKPFVIAVSGKGGTGKTTISALLVRCLVEAGLTPVLAVDADPNANLHEALGLPLPESLGSMREDAFTKSIPSGMSRTGYIRYRFRKVIVEEKGYDLLAMGRPEGSGCYCFAHDLLQACMRMLEQDYAFIIIDNEAGMEHISRGTIGAPDLLVIVTDPAARSVRTVTRIREIAGSLGLSGVPVLTLVNRVKPGKKPDVSGIPGQIAWIPEDPEIEEADRTGDAIINIPDNGPAKMAVKELVEKLAGSRGGIRRT